MIQNKLVVNSRPWEECTYSAGQRRSEWCVWFAGDVFLQPHPPHSSGGAAPQDDGEHGKPPQKLGVG